MSWISLTVRLDHGQHGAGAVAIRAGSTPQHAMRSSRCTIPFGKTSVTPARPAVNTDSGLAAMAAMRCLSQLPLALHVAPERGLGWRGRVCQELLGGLRGS